MPGLDKSHRISVASEEEAPLLQQRVSRTPTAAAAAVSCSKQHSKDIDSGGECEPRTCRICFETEEGPSSSCSSGSDEPSSSSADNPLISPCLCSGSSRYVHRKCLQQWRTTNHRADAYFQCELRLPASNIRWWFLCGVGRGALCDCLNTLYGFLTLGRAAIYQRVGRACSNAAGITAGNAAACPSLHAAQCATQCPGGPSWPPFLPPPVHPPTSSTHPSPAFH